MARLMRCATAMDQRTVDLIARMVRFGEQVNALAVHVTAAPLSGRLMRRLRTAAHGAESSYQAACVAGWGEQFLRHIAAAARHAKRARQILQDLTQAHHVSIEVSRDLILEARGIENILTASKNTLQRKKARARPAHAGSV